MVFTAIYGLICLVSGDISLDYNILTATVILDLASLAGGSYQRVKLKI